MQQVSARRTAKLAFAINQARVPSRFFAWLYKLALLAVATTAAVRFAPKIAVICNFSMDVGAALFAITFCGFVLALWAVKPAPPSVAFPFAFAATCFYFKSGVEEVFRPGDWARVLIVIALMLAPLRLVARASAQTISWPTAYLPTLDGWRAIAILLVIVDHAARGFASEHHMPLPSAFIHGQHGVNIFFGISGLLITWKLLEERRHTGRISLTGFYRRRVYRIFPAALTFMVVVGALCVTGVVALNRIDLASTVLYFRNYIQQTSFVDLSTGHFWSLALEEQFYLVLPSLLLLLGPRCLQSAALLLIAACSAWRWYFFSFIAPPDASLSLRFRTDLRIDGLLCGCLMAIVLSNQRARCCIARVLSTPVWVGVLVAFALNIARHGEYTTLVESLLIPLLLAGTVLSPQSIPARILESKPLRWIGWLSYSLYIWQQLFLIVRSDNWLLARLQHFPVNIIAAFAFAAMSYYLIERPLIRRGQGYPTAMRDRAVPEYAPSPVPS